RSANCFSRSSNILRKNIQPSCSSRCASPYVPASFRIMSWIDLTRFETFAMWSGCFLVEFCFELFDRGQVFLLSTEEVHDLQRRSESAQWVDLQDFQRLHTLETTISIFVEKSVQHGPRFLTIFCKNISFLNVVSAFTARQWRLVEDYVTN